MFSNTAFANTFGKNYMSTLTKINFE